MQENQNPTQPKAPVLMDPEDQDHVLPPEATVEPELATTAPVMEQPEEEPVAEAAPEPVMEANPVEEPKQEEGKGRSMIVIVGLVALIAIALLVMLYLYTMA